MSRKDLPKITTEEIAKQVAEKLEGVSKKQVKNILSTFSHKSSKSCLDTGIKIPVE